MPLATATLNAGQYPSIGVQSTRRMCSIGEASWQRSNTNSNIYVQLKENMENSTGRNEICNEMGQLHCGGISRADRRNISIKNHQNTTVIIIIIIIIIIIEEEEEGKFNQRCNDVGRFGAK